MADCELKKQVEAQIERAYVNRALDLVDQYLTTHLPGSDHRNDITLLKSRYNRNEKNLRNDLIDLRDHGREVAKITHALVHLVNDICEENGSQPIVPVATHPEVPGNEGRVSPSAVRRILFLAANPRDTGRLRLDKEIREIGESLRRANKRDQFELEERLAVRPIDLSRALLDVNPSIVHFSGHGIVRNGVSTEAQGGLIFDPALEEKDRFGIALEDNNGNTQWVPTAALADMFRLFKDQIGCVVLNACYSRTQAEAIGQYIPYIVGMKHAVPDDTAIAFATTFYDALGAGRTVPFAFEMAKAAIALEGLSGEDLPVLLAKE